MFDRRGSEGNWKPPQLEIVQNRFVKRVDDVLLRHVVVSKNGKTFEYAVRVINKTARRRKEQRVSSSHSGDTKNGIERLLNEIDIRQQLSCDSLVELYAVRDTAPYVMLCKGSFCG